MRHTSIAQKNASTRNWFKCLLTSSFLHLQHMAISGLCTKEEKEKLTKAASILVDVREKWDSNWEEVKRNLNKR